MVPIDRSVKALHVAGLIALALFVAACGGAQLPASGTATTPERVSEFGVYEGYSEPRFDAWVTTSEFIETRDGTRLAVDISRPAIDGVAVDERFPVLWTYSRYHRRWGDEPNIDDNPILQRLIRHGYVIACVNVRGGGASFGRYEGLFSAVETRDAYDVIDWLAKQEFSNGNVGMYGFSYMGITQYMAASTGHPALKAITPENGYFDFYDAVRQGGILRDDMLKTWGEATQYLDKVRPPIPVDADTDGSLAAAAVREHENNFDPIAPLRSAKFRDSTAPEFDWLSDMPSRVIEVINASDVAIYHFGAWQDPYALDTLLHDANFRGTDKLAMGPWAHEPNTDAEKTDRIRIYGAEMHRWFDHWLKGVDNGIMEDPRVHVAEVDAFQQAWTWRAVAAFSPVGDSSPMYFGSAAGDTGDALPMDHQLIARQPAAAVAIEYRVDPKTTSGTATRWDSNAGGEVDYPDMAANDRRSLTFTSAPLDDDIVVAGIPLVELYLSATTPDVDAYALLEEVIADGTSSYVSEGMLRASLRRETAAPWDNLGLPWHRAYEEDRQPLTPGEIVELAFPMQPVAYRFNRGNRIRIVIMGADSDNTEAPPYPDAMISIQVGGDRASRVSLPLLPEQANAAAAARTIRVAGPGRYAGRKP